MLRILVFSDSHREFYSNKDDLFGLPPLPPKDSYDVVVAAGDIWYGMQSVHWLERVFPDHPVIFVKGNHEIYTGNFGQITKQYQDYKGPIKILDPGTIWIDGIQFIGATMWSDLVLKDHFPVSDAMVERAIADFRWGFTAADMQVLHQRELQFVENQLRFTEDDFGNNESTVVITHFVPTQLCISEQFKNSSLNPYFTNDHDWLMEQYKYNLHIFGHTHDRFDIVHPSGTRVVGNPHGYPRETPGFEWKIVEM